MSIENFDSIDSVISNELQHCFLSIKSVRIVTMLSIVEINILLRDLVFIEPQMLKILSVAALLIGIRQRLSMYLAKS